MILMNANINEISDQIREELIHNNYFSQQDIDICINFDISILGDHPHYGEIFQIS